MAKAKPKIVKDNYLRKILYLQRIGALPKSVGVHLFDVYHDAPCGIFEGKRCDCSPDIRLKCSMPDAAKN
jgi:hypothetical protein